jgi:hypothetical protein
VPLNENSVIDFGDKGGGASSAYALGHQAGSGSGSGSGGGSGGGGGGGAANNKRSKLRKAALSRMDK